MGELVKDSLLANRYITPRPPYPLASRMHYEQGTVVVRISYAKEGQVTAVSVVRSSGYPNLDGNTVNFIKAHWSSTFRKEKTVVQSIGYVLGGRG